MGNLYIQLFWQRNKRLLLLLASLAVVITLTLVTGGFGLIHASSKPLVADKTSLNANSTDCTAAASTGSTNNQWNCVINVTYSGDSTTALKLTVSSTNSLSGVTISATPDSVDKATTSKVTISVPFVDSSHDNCVDAPNAINLSDGTDQTQISWSCKHNMVLAGASNFKAISCMNLVCTVAVANKATTDLSNVAITLPSGITGATSITIPAEQTNSVSLTVDLATCTSATNPVTFAVNAETVSVNIDCTNTPQITAIPSSLDQLDGSNCHLAKKSQLCTVKVIAQSDLEMVTPSTSLPGVTFHFDGMNQASNVQAATLVVSFPMPCQQGNITLADAGGTISMSRTCSAFTPDYLAQLIGFKDSSVLMQDHDLGSIRYAGPAKDITCPVGLSVVFTSKSLNGNVGFIPNCSGQSLKSVTGFTFRVAVLYSTPSPWATNDIVLEANSLFGTALTDGMLIIYTDQLLNVMGDHADHILVCPLNKLNKAT